MSREQKHVSIGKWLNNDKFVAGLSLVLAVVIWLVVALQMSNQMQATFSEIPVTFETTMTDPASQSTSRYRASGTRSVPRCSQMTISS